MFANQGVKAVDPSQSLSDGVGGAAGQGGFLGGLMGAAGAGGSIGRQYMYDKATGKVRPEDAQEIPQNTPLPPTQPAQEATNNVAPTIKDSLTVGPEVTDAEKALHTPVALTALDRVNEIDQSAAALSARADELSQPGASYNPMSDAERTDLAAQQATLAQEKQELTKDWPKSVTGIPSSFTTEAGARVEAQYALMDAGDLITSHDEGLRKNPLYPPELQPRERDRAASEMQVSGIAQKLDPARLGLSADAANGAPIVGADGLVESGNARTIALKRVYQGGDGKGKDGVGSKAHAYREFLRDNAAQFGITPESVDAMAKPVLVRVRTTPVNRAEFARQANASTVAAMAPSEQAKSDANRIDSMDGMTPDDNGDFSNTASESFVKRFITRLPLTEQTAMMDADGKLSTAGYARVRNAVLAKAYGDSPVLARMTESMDDNLRNVSKALMMAAPKVAQMRGAVKAGTRFDADITPDLMASVEELSRLKADAGSVQDALAQTELMGDQRTPEARQMLQFLSDNMRRPRRMADFINAYMDALDAAGDPNQGSLLGDTQAPTKQDLLKAAERATTNEATNPGTTTQGAAPSTGGQAGQKPGNAPGSGSSPQGNGADTSRATQGAAGQASQPVAELVAQPAQPSIKDSSTVTPPEAMSFADLGAMSDGLQTQIDDLHDTLKAEGLSFAEQNKHPKMAALYSERGAVDERAAKKAYTGAKRVIEDALGKTPHTSHTVTVDSILQNRFSLTSATGAGVSMMSDYTGKALDDSKTVEAVAMDLTKLVVERDYPGLDFHQLMDSPMSAIGRPEKVAIIKEAKDMAERIQKDLRAFFTGNEAQPAQPAMGEGAGASQPMQVVKSTVSPQGIPVSPKMGEDAQSTQVAATPEPQALKAGDAVDWLANGKRASGVVVRAPGKDGRATVRATNAEQGAGVPTGNVYTLPVEKISLNQPVAQAEQAQAATESVVNKGDFGPILTQFKGDAQGAIKALTDLQDGEAVAALNHPEVGDIDLVWGRAPSKTDEGHGLAKISVKHPEVLNDLQGFLNRLHKDDSQSGKNRIRLVDEKGTAVVRLQWEGKSKTWLLTAFEDAPKAVTRTDTDSVSTKDDTASLGLGSKESIAPTAAEGKQEPCPTRCEPERHAYFQPEMSLKG